MPQRQPSTKKLVHVEKFTPAEQLSLIGKMVGEIAHSFNNVLGGILGYAQLLENELEQNSRAFEHAKVIERAARRASKMALELHALSNSRIVFDTNAIDLEPLLEELVRRLRDDIEKPIRIQLSMNHGSKKVMGSSSYLLRALYMIAENGVENMQDSGELTIRTQVCDIEEIAVFFDKKGYDEGVLIRITDNGEGIAPEAMTHIFSPFYSTKSENPDRGLGLTLANAIIRSLKGGIEVQSEVGVGSTFNVYLPAAKTPATSRHKQPRKNVGQQQSDHGGRR